MRIDMEDFFVEDIEFDCWPDTHYDIYTVRSVDGIVPNENKIKLWYYYDQQCLPFDCRTPGLAGKLCICVNEGAYGVKAAGDVRFFNTRESAEASGSEQAYVEGEDQLSIVDLLTWAYQCTFPNGNHVSYAVNDYDECYAEALYALNMEE